MHSKDGNKIGLLGAVSYCVGDIIGSGIFVSPTSILKHTGSVGLSLCVWAVCACISVIGALVYIELGTSIRRSGCDFAYLSHVKWHPLAVAFLWVSCCLSYPSTLAIQSTTLGKYVVAGLTPLLRLQFEENTLFYLEKLIAFSVLWVLAFINMFSLKRFAARFQEIATLAKLLATALIIVTGFYYLIFKKGYTSAFENSFEGSASKPGDIVLGLYAGLFAYNGWDILNFGAEEIENPRKTLPIAAFCGIAISALVFLSMNVSYFALLTVDEFKSSEAVAVKFAQKSLGDFSYAVPFLISILLLGNLNTTIFGCSRYLFAGANRRVMPSFIRTVHADSMSPRVAVFVELIVCVCVSFIGNLDHLISYMMFTIWMQRTIVQIALLYMRFSNYPVHPDAFKNPIIVPVLFFSICLCLLAIPIWQDFYVAVYGLSLVAVGLLVYFAFIFPNTLPKFLHFVDEKTTIFAQIIFNVIPVECGEDNDETEPVSVVDISENSRQLSSNITTVSQSVQQDNLKNK